MKKDAQIKVQLGMNRYFVLLTFPFLSHFLFPFLFFFPLFFLFVSFPLFSLFRLVFLSFVFSLLVSLFSPYGNVLSSCPLRTNRTHYCCHDKKMILYSNRNRCMKTTKRSRCMNSTMSKTNSMMTSTMTIHRVLLGRNGGGI